MPNFTDDEDRMLVQVVREYEAAPNSVNRIPWQAIANKMKTKKRPEQLRLRIRCLKRRFGHTISNFPSWYFISCTLRRRPLKLQSVEEKQPACSVRDTKKQSAKKYEER
jgi:hypothetical protein